MKADHRAYKRATAVSLAGLALQLLLGLGLLIYGFLSKDHAAQSGAYFVLLGSAVWVSLALVFDQHRRERLELLESEMLASSGAGDASVFEQAGDDLRVQARRLAWMHKVFVPVVSLLLAGALVGIGLWRFYGGRALVEGNGWKPSLEPGWAIGVGIGLGVAGFLFARFVSGMAKHPAWANLRAGASQAAGASVVGVLLALGQLVDNIGPDVVARYLPVVIPGVMIVLGGEIVLNFLLDMYRPRRPGEVPRPAMDSRILGFVAAPERIAESVGGALNYQFGFDVTSSWFYQLLTRYLVALLGVLALVVWLMTTVAIVQPNEQGLRVRLGSQINDQPLEEGLHFKWPWPLEYVRTFQTETIRRVDLGAVTPTAKGAWVWTAEHGVEETYFLVQPSRDVRAEHAGGSPFVGVSEYLTQSEQEMGQAGGASGDQPSHRRGSANYSLVVAEAPLYYRVNDYSKFERLGAPDQREAIIRSIGRRTLLEYLAAVSMDDVLGPGRLAAKKTLREQITRRLDREFDAGVEVTFVGFEGVHPPRDTAAGFESVVKAQQQSAAALQTGEAEANTALIKAAGSVEMARKIIAALDEAQRLRETNSDPARLAKVEEEAERLVIAAGGEASALIHEARAGRWTQHMSAKTRAEASASNAAAYAANPSVYIAREYFRTLKDIMADARVYITDDATADLHAEVDLKDPDTAGNVFGNLRPKEEPPQ